MPLPSFLQPYLASYNLSRLDPNAREVRDEIINQVLNSGSDKAVKWLFKTYSLEEIKSALKNPKKGFWFPESINYWSKILEVDINGNLYKRAIVNLNPFSAQ